MAITERPYDASLLRKAFDMARRSREGGDHPFGSILADRNGNVLLEQCNGYSTEGGDRTAHAEKLIATRAGKAYDLKFLAECTMYTSAEPCAMCSGAVYWAGIGRVVFGLSESDMKRLIGPSQENPTLDLPCRTVFAAGQRPTEVVGPMLADEAAKLHEEYWAGR